jgi:hypothetical protein
MDILGEGLLDRLRPVSRFDDDLEVVLVVED